MNGRKELQPEDSNVNFVQFSREYMKNWRTLIARKPLSASILMFLIEKSSSQVGGTNAVVCSYKVLEEITGYGRSSVASAVKILREENWIQVVKIGTTHAYAVNERVAWRGGKNGRKYSIFSATVIGTESEQASADMLDTTKLKRVPLLESGEFATVGGGRLPPPDQQDIDL